MILWWPLSHRDYCACPFIMVVPMLMFETPGDAELGKSRNNVAELENRQEKERTEKGL